MVDYRSAMWGYGFGRIEAEIEAEERAKKRLVREIEPILLLEKFEVSGLETSAAVKNSDNRPASVSGILFLEVLEPPRIVEKKGLVFKRTKVKVADRIDKAVRPTNVFTVLPGGTFTFSIELAKPLEANRSYMLELHMGKKEYYSPEKSDTVVARVGWAYMLKFDGKNANCAFTMNLEQAGDFWGRKIAHAKGKWGWKNLYVTFPWEWEHLPYEYF